MDGGDIDGYDHKVVTAKVTMLVVLLVALMSWIIFNNIANAASCRCAVMFSTMMLNMVMSTML